MIKYESDELGYISVVEVSDKKKVGSNKKYISETSYVNSSYNKGYGYIDTIKPKEVILNQVINKFSSLILMLK